MFSPFLKGCLGLVIIGMGLIHSSHASPTAIDCSTEMNEDWKSLVCRETADNVDSDCLSTRWLPSSATTGLVVLMHGYTACPESFNDLATRLQSEGYAVFNVRTVGHGIEYEHCPTEEDCVNKDNVASLPVHADEYLAWVDEVNKAVRTEATALGVLDKVSVVGLSLGSALGTAAMIRDQDLYQRAVVYPPFYGVSVPDVDRSVQDCSGTKDECIENFINSLVGSVGDEGTGGTSSTNDLATFFASVLNDFITGDTLEGGYASIQSTLRPWAGETSARPTGLSKTGICNFRIKNLLAVHAIGEYALAGASSGKILSEVQFVLVERDGYTRNGMVAQAAKGVNFMINGLQEKSHMCIYRVKDNCDVATNGNECSPLGMEDQTVRFITTGTPFGDGTYSWDGTMDNCQVQNLNALPSNLFAQADEMVSVLLNCDTASITDEKLSAIAKDLSKAAGFSELTLQPVKNADVSDSHELGLFGSPAACSKVVMMVKNREIVSLASDETIYVKSATHFDEEGEEVSDSCPVEAKWDTSSSNLNQYYYGPFDSATSSSEAWIGFKEQYAHACEECGRTSGSGKDVSMYNYKWNENVGKRDFWEDEGKGWNEVISWWKWCPLGYERDSWKWWKAKCVIGDSTKFLGETCEDKDQCDNGFVRGLVDVTCAPTVNDENDPDWKCVFDEEANEVSPYASTCSCIGLIWCISDDCGGN
ncbi:hypothetical protein TrLO_g343 [Triparma laevis f. longispina]|uniref:Serine aminopeptidase S33 domain-containing protein n=2 Tax=Triparma laevis f. longispina TaxID=1714387 RepID=A0A9W7C9H3_9STRA|nr:hypothetical protein TrLO_g343 [Triparma laevis f. longispina]